MQSRGNDSALHGVFSILFDNFLLPFVSFNLEAFEYDGKEKHILITLRSGLEELLGIINRNQSHPWSISPLNV